MMYGPARIPPEENLPANVILFTNFHLADWRPTASSTSRRTAPRGLDAVLGRVPAVRQPRLAPGERVPDPAHLQRLLVAVHADPRGPDRRRVHARRGVPQLGAGRPKLYLAARLWWEPKADVNALLGQFCRDLFGPAAGDMEAYFREWEKLWIALDNTKGPERKLFLWDRQF